jgi:hypothetical protein
VKRLLFATAAALSVLGAAGASAAPIYVGYQIGNGAITIVLSAPSGNGPFNYGSAGAPISVGTSGIVIYGTVEGTPPLPEPDLLSNAVSLSGEHDPSGGPISIYVTELNQFPTNFGDFYSTFGANLPATGPSGPNDAISVVESTYVHACANPGGACLASDEYQKDVLLSTTTFSGIGSGSTVGYASLPPNETTPYAVTEVYTVNFTPNGGYGQVNASIAVTVPEPLSIGLLGSGLFALGLIRRSRA